MRGGRGIEVFKGAFEVAVMERLCLRGGGESPKNSAGGRQGEGGESP